MSKTAAIKNIEANVGEISNVRAQFNRHLAEQPAIVRATHKFLKGFQLACIALAGIFWVVGIIVTVRWAFTGDLSGLAEAWVNYGLSMSFLVLPMGLDVLLLRVHPTDIYTLSNSLDSTNRTKLTTGVTALLAGLAITLGGAPGTVHMINLARQALESLF